MKNKVILCLFILMAIGCVTLTTLKTQSATNYSYTPYTSQNIKDMSGSINNYTKDSQVLFIVDFSNSMNEKLDGQYKIDLARTTMAEILPKISPDTKIGLRVYGHRSGFTYLQGCQASNLIVPINYGNYQEILKQLYRTSASGWTPITYSLKQAINNDFNGISGLKHIILLTDGGENCDESPCTFIINAMKTRNDIKIDVIAFDIHDKDANDQLRCTALMTNGKFMSANSQRDLSRSLFESVGIKKEVSGSVKIPSE